MKTHLVVSVPEQKVILLAPDKTQLWTASVSTSSFGLGEEEGSYRTPRGVFYIAAKIGEGEPLGMIFKSRQPTGVIWTPCDSKCEEDLILTRILWLAGSEPHNLNTQQRYIYFHGTNHEDKVGTPASHGCIRLRNQDMMELFDRAEVGMSVTIA